MCKIMLKNKASYYKVKEEILLQQNSVSFMPMRNKEIF